MEQKEQNSDLAAIAQRMLRLEERLDRLEVASHGIPMTRPVWPLVIAVGASSCGILGMGVPSHPYPYLFAGLLLALAYHRGFLRPAGGWWRWPLAAANFLNLVLFFLIVLGGGVRHPLGWFRSPVVEKGAAPEGGTWYRTLVPDYSLHWQAIPGVTDWSLDLTKIQVFLLIATMAAALFRFQGLASVTALALLVVSLPVYLSFTWDWVIAFLVLASIAFYLQTAPPSRSPRSYDRR